MTAHWGVPDPAAVEGTPEQVEKAFPDAFMMLDRRISLFLALPSQHSTNSLYGQVLVQKPEKVRTVPALSRLIRVLELTEHNGNSWPVCIAHQGG